VSLHNPIPVAPLPAPAERMRLRVLFGITQGDIAHELGVTRKTVYAWEHGRSIPTGDNRARYAAMLVRWAEVETEIGSSIRKAGDDIDLAF
jgi:DNA-binding XRE family transcriptional regulator